MDRMLKGGCHCGALRYEVKGEAAVHYLCHCNDCRRHAGAPMVGWATFPEDALDIIKGQPKIYTSSEHVTREFCPDCGTGLFYRNANLLPGLVDIQTGTLDEPNQLPAQCHIQTAEKLSWMLDAHNLPEHERFPPSE
ncbi:MAG: GFA family protein [Rickettsiales bacterium]